MIATDNNWLSSRQQAQYKQEMKAASTFIEKVKTVGSWAGVNMRQHDALIHGFKIGLLKGGISDLKGVGNALFGIVKGIAYMLCHPIECIEIIHGVKQ